MLKRLAIKYLAKTLRDRSADSQMTIRPDGLVVYKKSNITRNYDNKHLDGAC